MEKYVCKTCKYSCEFISQIKNHFELQKHCNNFKLENEHIDYTKLKIKCYECKNCNTEFYNRNCFWRHKTDCANKYKIEVLQNQYRVDMKNVLNIIANKDKEHCEQMNKALDIVKDKEKKYSEQMNKTLDIVKDNSVVVNNALNVVKINSKTINSSMQILRYAELYLRDAEPLKQLKKEDTYEVINYINPDNKENTNTNYINIVLHKFKHKNFANFIGDMIIDNFSPKSIEKTNFLSTDTSRLCFIIMEKIKIKEKKNENIEKKEWLNDKSGKRFTELILTPIIMSVRDTLTEFISINNEKTHLFSPEFMNKLGECVRLVRDIDVGKFTKPILKYVAPSFQFDNLKFLDKNIKNNNSKKTIKKIKKI
jgi:hypothetical protein